MSLGADELDVAATRTQAELDALLAAHRQQTDRLFGGPVDPGRCCQDRGEPIGLQRLLRIPGAVRCVGCQAMTEVRERQFAGKSA